jgi:hypothetical protein
MVNVLSSSVVDRGFIGGVMVNVLSSSVTGLGDEADPFSPSFLILSYGK